MRPLPGKPTMTALTEKPTPTKVESADKTLGVVTKVITIIGAAGTVLVWLTANFYTGEVKLKTEVAPVVQANF